MMSLYSSSFYPNAIATAFDVSKNRQELMSLNFTENDHIYVMPREKALIKKTDLTQQIQKLVSKVSKR